MTNAEHPDELRDIPFLAHDGALRDDVRTLGTLVGDMLAEQGGDDLFQQVESIRTAAIHRRESKADIDTLSHLVTGQTPQAAESLARAFATYFHAVNTAERVHRIRRRRDYQVAGASAQPESLAAVLENLKAQGVSADELMQWIEQLDVEPVFTAHPTEAVRRSLLEKEQAIVRALVADFDPARPPRERAADRQRMRTAITTGWQTAEASRVRPSVQDEFEHVSFYIAEPLYQVLPVFYESLHDELQRVYGIAPSLPRLLRFGSWVGGDMDGNPNVGADTIAETLRAQRAQVLQRYIGECAHLGRLLSQTDDRVDVSEALRQRLDDYRARLPQAAAEIRPRHADMPYRCLLTLMRARLEATLADASAGYHSVDAFEADVALIIASLAAHKGEHAGLFAVRRLWWRVRSFGFHLARLDVRQDSRVHDDVLAVLLDDADWVDRDAKARAERLRPYASGGATLRKHGDAASTRLHAVFATLADARQRYGADAIGPYIISMARTAADVLAVLALARHGGLVEGVPGEGGPVEASEKSPPPPTQQSASASAAASTPSPPTVPSASASVMASTPSPPTAPSSGERAGVRGERAGVRGERVGVRGERVGVNGASAASVAASPQQVVAASAGFGVVPLDIAPLFETVDDLKHAAASLRALLADSVYRAHLESRGNRQLIMLGYSDSAKDGGLLAARWALQRAQVELLEVAADADVSLTFFHGRGGSASRGGSRVTPALMASPRGAVAGRLRMTEQGEVIHRKYGIRALALRNLEQTVGAVLRASMRPRDPEPREATWRAQMTAMAKTSGETYRALVTDKDFVDYFRRATPIDVIEHMTMGSRPASRRSMHGVEDLRAIPWVFAWTQCRLIMPGWYGLGSALQQAALTIGEDALVEMARDWPFLSTLLDDVEMVLAKADLDIAETFSRLSGPLHQQFFPRLRAEFGLTLRWVLRLQGSQQLLAVDRRLALSIRLRNPYVDPMSLLQVDLLRRWRAHGSDNDALLRALVACVNGVSQGLQNTG